ncbi:hypothetical protein JCGZ_25663 [Jatropha curcas]|uniref:Uncharacterized protein n=1 Tax=Jatropha curcas TaxID=180498 RepID=A0A067JKF7_JATCU|nr:hypothetical protein JCGZ_25663 [Jatropha curcas]
MKAFFIICIILATALFSPFLITARELTEDARELTQTTADVNVLGDGTIGIIDKPQPNKPQPNRGYPYKPYRPKKKPLPKKKKPPM